jgi:D-alanine-D-alanine ligase-like ATP-grasp enzyme
MDKPEYIQKFEEKSGQFLSVLRLGIINNDSISETNYYLMYISSQYTDDKIYWTDKILKTKHGFYLYLNRYSDTGSIVVDIYHNPEQLNELSLFVKQFIKQNKK